VITLSVDSGDKHNQQVSIRSIGKAISRLHINWKRPRHTLARQALNWQQAKGGLNTGSGRMKEQ